MTDILSAKDRSARMRMVKSKHTGPELAVRKICRESGYIGYRLHRQDLPGKPDIAFVGRKKAIFVHGCFWHMHNCHGHVRLPKSRQEYWLPKIERNISRDAENIAALKAAGWQVLVIWECEVKNPTLLAAKLSDFLS